MLLLHKITVVLHLFESSNSETRRSCEIYSTKSPQVLHGMMGVGWLRFPTRHCHLEALHLDDTGLMANHGGESGKKRILQWAMTKNWLFRVCRG